MSAQSHSLAVSMEWSLRRILNCEKLSLGGFINSDNIEKHPLESFRIGLAVKYGNANKDTRTLIDKFMENVYQYDGQCIDEIGVEKVSQLYEGFKTILTR